MSKPRSSHRRVRREHIRSAAASSAPLVSAADEDAMPYPHQHAARVADPGDFEKDSFKSEELAPGVSLISAKKKDSDGSMVAQSYRFDSKRFTAAAARQWLEDNDVKDYSFEEAAEDEDGSDEESRSSCEAGDRIRQIVLRPQTVNEETRSVEAVIATDDPVFSTDLRTQKPVHEVWRMDGMEVADSIPLLDNHDSRSIRNVLGSIRSCQAGPHEATGRLYISEAEPDIWTKIREGHIDSVSGRAAPIESSVVPAGRSQTVRGATYTARSDQPLFVHTRWLLREASLTPIGADPKAKIRSHGDSAMPTRLASIRSRLAERTRGMAADALCEEACRLAAECCRRCAADQSQASCRDSIEACTLAATLCYQCGLPCCIRCAETCWRCADACRNGPSPECRRACEDCATECETCAAECGKSSNTEGQRAGRDPEPRTRPLPKEQPMNEKLRKYLEGIGLDAAATADEAQAFYQALPEKARSLADAKAKEPDPPPKTDTGRATTTDDADRIRKEAAEAGAKAERVRQAEIHKLADDVAPELAREAIEDGWTIERVQESVNLLAKFRDRTRAAAPAAHSRSASDATPEVLGMAFSLRSLNSLRSGETGQSFATDPTDLFACYQPAGEVCREGTDWVYRPAFDTEGRKKAVGRLLDTADRFRSLSAIELCRMACEIEGKHPITNAETIRTAASTGAFAAIFTTSFNALFLSGYLEASDTTIGWCSESDVPNFLAAERAAMGKFGNLALSAQNKPAEHLTAGDWNEILRVHRYTGQFVVDEKDLINDRFGALNQMSPQEMGLSARRLRPNLVYSTLLSNPTLNQDATALFDAATHINYATTGSKIYDTTTGAVSVAPIQTAIAAINSQRLNRVPLNLQPRFMLISPALRWGAAILFQSAERVIASGSGGTYNPLRDIGIEPRMDARLGTTGCFNPLTGATVAGNDAAWFLVCKPGEEGAKTIEVAYLQGTGRSPQIRSFVLDRGQWGIGWDVKLDIGCAPLDFRGMYYATGAA